MTKLVTVLIGKVLSQELETVRAKPLGKTDELLKEIIFGDGLAYFLWGLDMEIYAEDGAGEMPLFIEFQEFPTETVVAQITVDEQEAEILQALRDSQAQWSEVQFWQNVVHWGTSNLEIRLSMTRVRQQITGW